MISLIVTVYVKKECIDDFIKISKYNSQNSLNEPGCVRFDVLQQTDDETIFNLYEIYKEESDIAHHHTTEHYQTWRAKAADMMAKPRSAVKANLL